MTNTIHYVSEDCNVSTLCGRNLYEENRALDDRHSVLDPDDHLMEEHAYAAGIKVEFCEECQNDPRVALKILAKTDITGDGEQPIKLVDGLGNYMKKIYPAENIYETIQDALRGTAGSGGFSLGGHVRRGEGEGD